MHCIGCSEVCKEEYGILFHKALNSALGVGWNIGGE